MIQHFGAGQRPPVMPGDLLLVHGSDLLARICQWGQKRRPEYQNGDAWRWNHVACAVTTTALIEATECGVHRTPLAAYDNSDTWLIRVSATVAERDAAADFLIREYGHPYNLLDLAQLGVWLGLHRELPISERGAWTCSELAAEMLRQMGQPLDEPYARTLPADIALHFGVAA